MNILSDADTKVERIRKRNDFLVAAKKGKKAVASTVVVQGYEHKQEKEEAVLPVRVGFTVTKKVGSAVVRNRVRRRLRAAVAEMITQLGQPGWDYVVIGRWTALDAPFSVIKRDLRYALKKVVKPVDEVPPAAG